MGLYVKPHEKVGRSGGSFQECDINTLTHQIIREYGRYCTIRDNEFAPPTSVSGRFWHQIYKTPDNTE